MTDEDREKFDAIRMNLELVRYHRQIMRARIGARDVTVRMEGQEFTAQMRESVRDLRVISSQVIASIPGQEARIRAVEGKVA